jgi:hypothetical protein
VIVRASWPMFLAAIPLALWGFWVLWPSAVAQQWTATILGLIAIATATGLLLLQSWAKYIAYAFAAGLALNWVYAIWQVTVPRWPYPDSLTTVLSLIPGACLLAVCAGGSYVVHQQYRQRVRET